jgi:hypothetical protein
MTDVFSQYVTLVDEIEQIPVTARESPSLSPEERAEAVAGVAELVRDRVLPQSDRDCAGREALLEDDDASPIDRAALAGAADHEAILAALDELVRVNPANAARVQELLYRVHAAISAHFSQAELMMTSISDYEPSSARVGRITGRLMTLEHSRPSAWFG